MKAIFLPLLCYLTLLCLGLAALCVASQWGNLGLSWSSLREASEALSAIPGEKLVFAVLIPCGFAGMACDAYSGSFAQAVIISACCAVIAGLIVAGAGFVIFVGAAAVTLSMLGYYAQRHKAHNKPL